jgi:hypothetical protein
VAEVEDHLLSKPGPEFIPEPKNHQKKKKNPSKAFCIFMLPGKEYFAFHIEVQMT